MSIEDKDTIDGLIYNKENDIVYLVITDHLDWNDVRCHIAMLKNKLETYIHFVESGQIFETYPKALDKRIIVEIVGKFEFSQTGVLFLERLREFLKNKNINLDINYRIWNEKDKLLLNKKTQ